MVKIITTSFGSKFHPAVERLGRQIEDLQSGYVFGVITESTIMHDKKLHSLKKFIIDNANVKNTSKGFLWYVWKPWVLLRTIIDLDENEVFVYLDAGTEISIDGKKNFQAQIDFAKKNGTFFFRNPQFIRDYTKPEVLNFFHSSGINFDKNQIAAGVIFMRNDFQTRKLLREWSRLSLQRNGSLFDDSGFNNHRHDQSILSIIVQKYKFQITNYPIWFSTIDYRSSELISYPIHTLRNPSRVSLLSSFKKINKIPNRFWNVLKNDQKAYLYLVKIFSIISRTKSTEIIWDEKWEGIWAIYKENEFKQIYHRTAGDLRDLSVSWKFNFRLKVVNKHIIISKLGVFKDLNTNIVYYNQYKQFGKITDNILFKTPVKLQGKYVALLSLNDNNFFHFIYDLLYKALFVKNLNLDFVCIIKDNFIWKTELLELYGLKYIIEKSNFIEIENALIVNSPIYSGEPSLEVCNILNKYLPKILRNKNLPKKILIFRKKARTRKIVNEDSFFILIEKYGFVFIELEDFSITEQIELFQNAEIIIAAHGAGLSWLFACSSDCIVIEFFSKNYLNYLYARISEKLNLKYYSFICEAEFSRDKFDPDIIVSKQIMKDVISILE